MNQTEISYDRATVLSEIQYIAGHRLPVLADRYLEEAEMFRRVYDNADTNDGACRIIEAARGLAKLHARDDTAFSTEVFLSVVFHTLRTRREY